MQGFNMGRYYPPDVDNAPSFNRTSHPLGARAKKINQGILTVRFELPFAVWCQHCKPEAIVGQGVRFNAEKKKAGTYYSTPIWSFRMKHTACGGWWEIRTDPQNSEYVCSEGCRRRDYGPEGSSEKDGEMAFLTEEERQKRREDAFAGLEGRIEGKGAEKRGKERVEELLEASQLWEDPYTANQKLRGTFRIKRKFLEREDGIKESLKDKFSFSYDIAEEKEVDKVTAGLVEFGNREAEDISRRPLFQESSGHERAEVVSKKKRLKKDILAEKSRKDLHQTLVGNTRAAIDPFLLDNARIVPKSNLGLLKRKRDEAAPSEAQDETPNTRPPQQLPASSAANSANGTVSKAALVDYDSD